MARRYDKVWTGGTFDHLHEGHQELLRAAFDAGERVVIGLTADDVVRGKEYAWLIQPIDERRAILEQYLDETYGRDRYEVVVQGSVYTDASLDPELQANVLCYKTTHHFDDINRAREEAGVQPLEPVMSAGDHKGVSSTRIRERLHRERTGGA